MNDFFDSEFVMTHFQFLNKSALNKVLKIKNWKLKIKLGLTTTSCGS